MATNNDGHALESWTLYTGNPKIGNTSATVTTTDAVKAGTLNNVTTSTVTGAPQIDLVWGNFPLQPNDERRGSVSNFGGSTYDQQWSQTTLTASGNLAYGDVAVTVGNNPTRTVPMDNHVRAEAGYASYPAYTPSLGNFIVTAISGDGTTVTFTSQNTFKPGDSINVTGAPLSGFNYAPATVATATATSFTVSDSTVGSYTGLAYVKAEYASAASNDGAYISGVDYVLVPNVYGLTTAAATDALQDSELVVTVASAVTPVISAITLASNVVSVTATGHGYKVGDVVTVAGLTNGSGSAANDADLNGAHTITAVSDANNFSWAQTHGNITTHSGLSGNTAKVAARAGTIKAQSIAAGASSIAAGAAITITPYFAS